MTGGRRCPIATCFNVSPTWTQVSGVIAGDKPPRAALVALDVLKMVAVCSAERLVHGVVQTTCSVWAFAGKC